MSWRVPYSLLRQRSGGGKNMRILDGSGSLELLITCQVSEAVTQALQVSRYQGAMRRNPA